MPSRIFRLYSFDPNDIFLMAKKRWPSAIVRRHAWKVGGSPVWYTTLVFDDEVPANAFEEWLARNARRQDIRSYIDRGKRRDPSSYYKDVVFHRGGLSRQIKIALGIISAQGIDAWFKLRRRLSR